MPHPTRRTLLALALLAAAPVAAQTPALGLAERRAIASYQSSTWPGVLAGIERAAGFPVPVEVEWNRLALPGQAANYSNNEFWGATIFQPLTAALTDITQDAMGRDALRAKLKKIVITYDDTWAPASNYPNGLRFSDGTLTVNWAPYQNVADVQPRTTAIVRLLEANL